MNWVVAVAELSFLKKLFMITWGKSATNKQCIKTLYDSLDHLYKMYIFLNMMTVHLHFSRDFTRIKPFIDVFHNFCLSLG